MARKQEVAAARKAARQVAKMKRDAANLLLKAVIKEATYLMRRYPRLAQFRMAMGSWDFTHENGEFVDDQRRFGVLKKLFREDTIQGDRVVGAAVLITRDSNGRVHRDKRY